MGHPLQCIYCTRLCRQLWHVLCCSVYTQSSCRESARILHLPFNMRYACSDTTPAEQSLLFKRFLGSLVLSTFLKPWVVGRTRSVHSCPQKTLVRASKSHTGYRVSFLEATFFNFVLTKTWKPSQAPTHRNSQYSRKLSSSCFHSALFLGK